MNPFYKTLLKAIALPLAMFLLTHSRLSAQTVCAAAASDDQTVYGTNNVWIGYAYQSQNFTYYQGHVTEGTAASPNFYENFTGAQTWYNTSGCQIYTDHFSMRYKLAQSFVGNYTITVGGDDGYRFSVDGGATWVINKWNDQSYTTTSVTVNLTGMTNFVLEYYENGGDNVVSFNIVKNCSGTGDQTIYGTGNVWNGYMYQGMNFDTYKGAVTEGAAGSPNFDENFGNPGGSNSNTYNTSQCSITTYQFSARYRLTQNLLFGTYIFTVGGDDGYRFSLDGGSTWVISYFSDHSYATTTYSVKLYGSYNMVLEYYDNGGYDRVSFLQTSTLLPVTITSWSVTAQDKNQALLKWTTTDAVNFDHFIVQRSTNGSSFDDVQTVAAINDGTNTQNYTYTDQDNFDGKLYYRIAMVDRDGTTSYSNIQSISLQQAQSLRIYPTRIENGSFIIETSTAIRQAKAELFDMNGRKLQQTDWSTLEGRQTVTLKNSASLPAGAYIIRLSDPESILAKQIVIIN